MLKINNYAAQKISIICVIHSHKNMLSKKKIPKSRRPPLLLLSERLMALLVLANVMLVVFDFTYIKIRDWYLKADLYFGEKSETPQQKYLKKVDFLQAELKANSLDSPKIENLLQDLQSSSISIFINRPVFRVINDHGSLAKIQKIFTSHVEIEDFAQAVEKFWQKDYLQAQGWQGQLNFFNSEIRPLILLYEPQATYDIIKGIEPFRDSQKYLQTVNKLKIKIKQQGLAGEEIESLLQELRQSSTELIDQDYYFQIVNQITVLAKIKYRIKQHIYSQIPDANLQLTPTLQLLQSLNLLEYLAPEVLWADKSSKEAFNIFWSREYLEMYGWEKELEFFEENIEFLMQSFYFRSLSTNGEFVDRFWLVDLPWLTIFWIEFLGRILLLSRRPNVTFFDAIKRRWYDIFLLQSWLPLLRIITAVIRLHKVKLPNMEQLITGIRLKLIGSFGKEITEVVVGGGIDQLQNNISKGSLRRALFESKKKSNQVDIVENDSSKILEIVNQMLEVIACKVLPEIHSDLEDFLNYQVEKSMRQLSIYRRLQRIPFLRRLPNKIAHNLTLQISNTIATAPQKVYQTDMPPDSVSIKLRQQLVEHFTSKLVSELQSKQTVEEIEILMIDWLEEIKINYVKPPKKANLKLPQETIPKIMPKKVIELKAEKTSKTD
ncbi:MAG: hypothetical protein WBA93_27195 [Microcoleaceae cyanobacterium]